MTKQLINATILNAVLMSVSALMLVGCSNNQMTTQERSGPMMDLTSPTPPVVLAASQSIAANQYEPADHRVVMSDLNMNSQGSQITIKPSEMIHATAHYVYDCKSCTPGLNHQIIVGLAGRSAQACIYNGGMQGQGATEFALKVPAKPGKYQVRFRSIQALDCNAALQQGWDEDTTPTKESTIGMIIVSRKAMDDIPPASASG